MLLARPGERTVGKRRIPTSSLGGRSCLTERSVVTTTSFIPVGKKLFFYVAGEYDVAKPGGQAEAGLSYAFVNARWSVSSRVELQGLSHRTHSTDARTLTQDQIDGRPVDLCLPAGFLYESADGVLVESRSQTDRFSLNGSVNLGRSVSLLSTAERSTDDTSESLCGTAGLSVRF